jgi:hypothetical protein
MLILITLGCTTDPQKDPDEPDRSANLLPAGASAGDLLQNADYSRLLIQIAYVNGFAPSDTAIEDLREFIMLRTFKEDIQFDFLPLPQTGKEVLSLQEVADLELKNRTAYNAENTLALYLFFSDAPSDMDDPDNNTYTLGAVYRNTSMVLYGTTIRLLASKIQGITVADSEAATLQHEFGHLLGLVDMGSDPINEHTDPDSENHCFEADCLMQASLKFNSGLGKTMRNRIAKQLTAVPDLGPECLRDLKAAGGR